MCSSYGYKSLPYVLALISLIEMVLGIVRIIIFFSDKSSGSTGFIYSSIRENGTISSPLLSSTQAKAAFALDWIASIIPTFMGIYVVIFMLVAACTVCVVCCGLVDKKTTAKENVEMCSGCTRLMCRMCLSKPNHRCVSLTCNCPCYKARPRLRFQVRIGLLTFFIVLRIIAIILYASDKSIGVYGAYMAVICTISLCFLVLMIAADFYQYQVWWDYRPDGAYKRCRCLCCKQRFYPSHERFLPAPLLGKYREEHIIGNRPCQNTVSGYCPNLSLDHIVIFHAFDFKPLRRFRPDVDKTYIGFHRTTPDGALGIARTGFRISSTPPQMLGFGVYFARSFADTEGKARFKGAYICAKIEMGRVRMVNKSELREVASTDSWWSQYDTIYYAHDEENRDEFCIKDPKQIIKWIIIMDDERLRRYGLDTEFANTRCGCI